MYLCGVTSVLYTSRILMGALLVNIVTTVFVFHMEYGLEHCCLIIPFICAHFLL